MATALIRKSHPTRLRLARASAVLRETHGPATAARCLPASASGQPAPHRRTTGREARCQNTGPGWAVAGAVRPLAWPLFVLARGSGSWRRPPGSRVARLRQQEHLAGRRRHPRLFWPQPDTASLAAQAGAAPPADPGVPTPAHGLAPAQPKTCVLQQGPDAPARQAVQPGLLPRRMPEQGAAFCQGCASVVPDNFVVCRLLYSPCARGQLFLAGHGGGACVY